MRILYFVSILTLATLAMQCSPMAPSKMRYGRTEVSTYQPSTTNPMTTSRMMQMVRLKKDMVPRGQHGRRVVRPMTPRYITIHSTQNYTAGAEKHALALKRGALRSPKTRRGNRIGYLIWHYTVDEKMAIQHMPTYEQGEHADFHGAGNRLSIGIEMCEERGSNIRATVERTAMLTAVLMKQKNIPLRNVVPHYHWPRKGRKPEHKNCPHFLLDDGKPGKKWRWFQSRVNHYYKMLNHAPV